MILLWLDDIRNIHQDEGWIVFSPIPKYDLTEIVWVKSYKEFVKHIEKYGLPDGICFDHDLADEHYTNDINPNDYQEKTGYDCAKWLINYCMDNNEPLPKWNVQSANPSGKANINGLLNNFKEKMILE